MTTLNAKIFLLRLELLNPPAQQQKQLSSVFCGFSVKDKVRGYTVAHPQGSVLDRRRAYTSQTCHTCNHIGLRSDKVFKWGHCGWHGDADLNGAINISKIGATVTWLRGSEFLSCQLSANTSGLLKASPF